MAGDRNTRKRRGGYNRRHDRNKFLKITNPNAKKTNIASGLSGILFSCTPHKENHSFREAVILIDRHLEALTAGSKTKDTPTPTPSKEKEDSNGASVPGRKEEPNVPQPDAKEKEVVEASPPPAPAPAPAQSNPPKEGPKEEEPKSDVPTDEAEKQKDTLLDSLDSELDSLRKNDTARRDDSGLFQKVETNIAGALFVQLPPSSAHLLSSIVHAALTEAKETKIPGVKHCMRMIPVFTTCYPKPEDVAAATKRVAEEHFPKDPNTSFAIVFKSKCNTGAHRLDYIPVVADAIHEVNKECKVDLENPDVTVIIEILKCCCFISMFKPYQQLAKLNLREAACPSPKPTQPTAASQKKSGAGKGPMKTTENEDKPQKEESIPEVKKEEGNAEVDSSENANGNDKKVETDNATDKGTQENAEDMPKVGNGEEATVDSTNKADAEAGAMKTKPSSEAPEEKSQDTSV